jgi:hypothetical protein
VLAMIREAGNGTADNKAMWTGTQAEILALIKQEGGGPKSGVCHNCNKPGHWLREWTEPRKDRGHSGAPNWKKVAPPAGTPTTKSVNEKTFNWCGKCNRWTTTHDTATHTGGAGGKTDANLGLVESTTAWDVDDHAAWHVGLDVGISMWDVWETFDPYIKLVQFGLLFHFFPIFASRVHCRHPQLEQVIRFAGTGAHHHNTIAEQNIQTIMPIARTMMLHAAVHWPDVADACLWPMAVQHAVFLHNHMPDPATGISPHDIFTRSPWEQRKFHDLHVWGCPVYCLEKAMHDGKKLLRWKPRLHRTMSMGLSAKHACTVPLVLNLDRQWLHQQSIQYRL